MNHDENMNELTLEQPELIVYENKYLPIFRFIFFLLAVWIIF